MLLMFTSWLCRMEVMVPNGLLLITQVELKATADSGGYTDPAHVT